MSAATNRPRSLRPALLGISAALGVYLIGYVGIWQWVVCRVEVPPGHSLLVRYKGPWPFGGAKSAPEGELVQTDNQGRPPQAGILKDMLGPGRHFFSPLEYEVRIVPDLEIPPGKLGVVVSKVGKSLPAGTYLSDEDGYKGLRRQVLTPGIYRLNAYAYEVRVVDVDACVEPNTRLRRREGDPTMIPPGYVGVVTNKAGNPSIGEAQGIQAKVLQPGIYFFNPEEKRVDVVSVGYNETSLIVETDQAATASQRQAASAAAAAAALKPKAVEGRGDRLGMLTGLDPVYAKDKGIEFPSNDGFTIHLDFTAIWGLEPDQAPDVVKTFGTLKDVEEKVILPQIGSICRLYGSKRGAVDLLVGSTREQFQDETSEELSRVLGTKNLTLLFGLTRHIYVPAEVREPIQRAKIADELTKTREQEQLTAKEEADLTEAKAKVTLEEQRTLAETEKLVAELEAEGEKKAKELEAETERLQAEIDAKTAMVQAQTTKLLGEANAKKVELTQQAEADRFRLYVSALGGSDAYNKYVFAEGLPDDVRLGIFYAGPGTLWTDLKGFEQTMMGKMASDSLQQAEKPAPSTTQTTTTGRASPR